MAKLKKLCYYNKNGEKKVNCYLINISKKVVQDAGIKDTAEIKITAQGNKIIIEQA